jgi:hypothetical protein
MVTMVRLRKPDGAARPARSRSPGDRISAAETGSGDPLQATDGLLPAARR